MREMDSKRKQDPKGRNNKGIRERETSKGRGTVGKKEMRRAAT